MLAAGTLTVSGTVYSHHFIVFFLSVNTAVAVQPQMSALFVFIERVKNLLMKSDDVALWSVSQGSLITECICATSNHHAVMHTDMFLVQWPIRTGWVCRGFPLGLCWTQLWSLNMICSDCLGAPEPKGYFVPSVSFSQTSVSKFLLIRTLLYFKTLTHILHSTVPPEKRHHVIT